MIEFEINTHTFLLGVEFSDCIAEDVESGEEFLSKTFSIGFLFFTIHFNFKPDRHENR